MRVGAQVEEALRLHRGLSAAEAQREAIAMLAQRWHPDPQRRARQYPFELSGGMCQRVMIAAALICRPRLLIADEPTTALDVTIQAQILDLMKRLRDEVGTSIVIITHDMGVVAEMADDVAVMYGGRVVERGPVDTIFRAPAHPYTHLLLATVPTSRRPSQERACEQSRASYPASIRGRRVAGFAPAARWRPTSASAGRLSHPVDAAGPRRCLLAHQSSEGTRMSLTRCTSPQRARSQGSLPCARLSGRVVKAVDGISFDIPSGRTVALVGESGCGKSTTAYAIIGLEPVTSGSIRFEGRDITHLDRRPERALASEIQIVFQDPSAALNPKMTIGDSIARAARHPGLAQGQAAAARFRASRSRRAACRLRRSGRRTPFRADSASVW